MGGKRALPCTVTRAELMAQKIFLRFFMEGLVSSMIFNETGYAGAMDGGCAGKWEITESDGARSWHTMK
jgi:hypothetical protein